MFNKDKFKKITENVGQLRINNAPNVIFIGDDIEFGDIMPMMSQKQNNDFFQIFEKSLIAQKILRESSNSKIVFVVDASSIISGRGRDFTEFLKSLDSHFGSKNLLDSSCLVVRSSSKEWNINAEIQSFVKNPSDRISDTNLQLLSNWLSNGKIVTFPTSVEYQSDLDNAQRQLYESLAKSKPIGGLNTKLFLPSHTIETQKQFYSQLCDNIGKYSKQFLEQKVGTNLNLTLDNLAHNLNLRDFKINYDKLISQLDYNKKYKISDVLSQLMQQFNLQKDIESQLIINQVRDLEEIENNIPELMPQISDIHSRDIPKLKFSSQIDDLKYQLVNIWDQHIKKVEDADKAYDELYIFCKRNEDFQSTIKKLGTAAYLKQSSKSEITSMERMFQTNNKLGTNLYRLKDFYKTENPLKGVIEKNVTTHRPPTFIDKAIFKSTQPQISKNLIEFSQNPIKSFLKEYIDYIGDTYETLYSQYHDAISALQHEYESYVAARENSVAICGCIVGLGSIVTGFLTGGATMLLDIAGGGCAIAAGFLGKNKLATKLPISWLAGNVEECYKQIPGDLREGWAEIVTFPEFSEYLKSKYQSTEPNRKLDRPENYNSFDANQDGLHQKLTEPQKKECLGKNYDPVHDHSD